MTSDIGLGTAPAAIDLNPLSWLGDAASAVAGSVWTAAMVAIWSASLWLLKLAFKIIDAFTTPDVSATGPVGEALPITMWIGASVAALMMFVQVIAALVRRDGKSIGEALLGLFQFGAVWAGFLGIAATLVAAARGLEQGILHAMLNLDGISQFDPTTSWKRSISDPVAATVMGVVGILIVIPAAFGYILIMFVRAATLILLVATAPISAAGLTSGFTKAWFWKSLRWFIACLLISPAAALVLGIGVKVSAGVVAGDGDKTAAAIGTVVVGAVMVAIGAVCPLVLFKLLAFVEPSTASGAALRQSVSDAGGLSGLLSGNQSRAESARSQHGSSSATQTSADGQSAGESAAETQTGSRLAGAMGGIGAAGAALSAGIGAITSVAHRAADVGADVLGQSGVGSAGYAMTPTDERSSRGIGEATQPTMADDGPTRPSGSGDREVESALANPPPTDSAMGLGTGLSGPAAGGARYAGSAAGADSGTPATGAESAAAAGL